jgi:hypothetical protein
MAQELVEKLVVGRDREEWWWDGVDREWWWEGVEREWWWEGVKKLVGRGRGKGRQGAEKLVGGRGR